MFVLVSKLVFVPIYDYESGRLGLPEQGSGERGMRVVFFCCSVALGVVRMTFAVLATDLKSTECPKLLSMTWARVSNDFEATFLASRANGNSLFCCMVGCWLLVAGQHSF